MEMTKKRAEKARLRAVQKGWREDKERKRKIAKAQKKAKAKKNKKNSERGVNNRRTYLFCC